MGCCIVVALIIAQMLAYRDRIKRLLGMKVDDDAGHDPLIPPDLRLRLRLACLPAITLIAVASVAYQHRHHLADLALPSALAAISAIAAAVCGGAADAEAPNNTPKETP